MSIILFCMSVCTHCFATTYKREHVTFDCVSGLSKLISPSELHLNLAEALIEITSQLGFFLCLYLSFCHHRCWFPKSLLHTNFNLQLPPCVLMKGPIWAAFMSQAIPGLVTSLWERTPSSLRLNCFWLYLAIYPKSTSAFIRHPDINVFLS